MNSILAPVDFSEPAKGALEYAATLAEGVGANLDVLHVWQLCDYVDRWVIETERPSVEHLDPNDYARDAAARELHELLSGVDLHGVRPRLRLECGDVGDAILHAAAEGYDLLVLGRGRPRRWRPLTTGVAERVARNAPCPVLTVVSEESEP